MMPENFSNSKCPKCESTFFEVVDDLPYNAVKLIGFIRCAECKVVIGTTDIKNIYLGESLDDPYPRLKK